MLLISKSVDVCVIEGLFEILQLCLLRGEGVKCLGNIIIRILAALFVLVDRITNNDDLAIWLL
jgi:hypothetical protein